jgi:hypothetical protein
MKEFDRKAARLILWCAQAGAYAYLLYKMWVACGLSLASFAATYSAYFVFITAFVLIGEKKK